MKTNSKKLALAGVLCAVACGQYASVSRIRQPVRASAAHGQCHLRRVPGPGLRRGRGLPGQPAAQHLRLRQPPGLPRQHVRRCCAAGLLEDQESARDWRARWFGTGIIGGLLSYPVAVAFMGVVAAPSPFTPMWCPSWSPPWAAPFWPASWYSPSRRAAPQSMRAALEH